MSVYTEFQPGKTAHGTSTSPDAAHIDIRQQSVSARRALLHGPLVCIMVSGYQIGTIPLAMLSATATRLPELLYANAINLPADTDYNGVLTLVQHLINVCRSKNDKLARLRSDMPVYQSLAVCQAAYRLSMTKYTCHIFRKMEAYISNTLLSYEEIDAVCRFRASHPRLYNRMVNCLTVMVREESIPDPEMFAQHCLAHPELNGSIVATMAWYIQQQEQAQRKREAAAWHKQQQDRCEQERVQREQARLRWVQEQARLQEQAAERKKRDAQRQSEEKKRAAHNSAMRQACLTKTRAAGKDRVMTDEEKKWQVGPARTY
ncbi:hypothetical protein E8E11_008731 [Didymella keratinophila]|nr:hypothetical protein E8E11_008731 [Didymella keratinophila]